MEEVNKRAFLFGEKRGANAHQFALGAAGVYEDLFGAFYRLERLDRPLRVGRFFDNLLPNGCKFFGGDNCRGMFTTLNLRVRNPLLP